MYLQTLEIQGFKSFAKKTRLVFEPGITAIVGPNGCGKSNVCDAIRWVLGEQRPTALRGGSMTDVIFNGTDDHRPMGMAEVSITFVDCEKQLGTEFNEVTITRRVFRTGEGQYFLNRTPCRLRDIQRLFMDTGIGTTSYSVMAQGQIDAILSSRPEDRRAIFEEASGITRFRADRKEALRKLEATEQNLSRLDDVLHELRRQIGSLQRQAARARRYKEIKAELQTLDLYVCQRPVRYFRGIESPVKHPEDVDMCIFRENTEDIYAGIEWEAGTPEAEKFYKFISEEMGVGKVRFPATSAYGVKPVSREGSERLIRSAIEYALAHGRKTVTLVHKGNIMKFTEGGFKKWGYELAEREYGSELRSGRLVVNDCICDAFLQNALLRPRDYEVIATMNLNGDYVSDALAACVGGIGIAPGANINYTTGHALFEATHGTAPKYANQDKVNPSSLALSGEMLLRHIGWTEAAELINRGIERAISDKVVTYDFARMMENATEVSCSGFARAVVDRM